MVIIRQSGKDVVIRTNRTKVGEIVDTELDREITISNMERELAWNIDCEYSLAVDGEELCRFTHFRTYEGLPDCLEKGAEAVLALGDDHKDIADILLKASPAILNWKQKQLIDIFLNLEKYNDLYFPKK